ncbi:hypothetical protein LZ575_12800 [Antarcticibacterium sp. 1MA-6-2]|uniref:hypothetical protein n=1 Tax=Antarcticibacterium sp. 1MA-6-2 TaxID=2908210 RepID=UPI001F1C5FA1|nr:hypothetical protein [Antarcticibacterium sp. 1MA-6-2]UJH89875.1 hypothetical protein LZ575_12800 [Antarcticibacterium sp. 1MA-6-2]
MRKFPVYSRAERKETCQVYLVPGSAAGRKLSGEIFSRSSSPRTTPGLALNLTGFSIKQMQNSQVIPGLKEKKPVRFIFFPEVPPEENSPVNYSSRSFSIHIECHGHSSESIYKDSPETIQQQKREPITTPSGFNFR